MLGRPPPQFSARAAFSAVLAACLLAGCLGKEPNTVSGDDPDSRLAMPLYLYLPLSPAEANEGVFQKRLRHVSGQVVTVRRIPALWAAVFSKITVLDDGAGVALLAELDRHGSFEWKTLVMERPGQKLAVAVGENFRFFLTIPQTPADYSRIVIRGPWSRHEAEQIAKRAAANYRTIHGFD